MSQRGYRESLTLLAASTSQRRKQIKAIISGNNSAFSVLTPSQFPRQGVSSGCSIRRSLERGFLLGKSFPSPLWRSFVSRFWAFHFQLSIYLLGSWFVLTAGCRVSHLSKAKKKSRVVQQFFSFRCSLFEDYFWVTWCARVVISVLHEIFGKPGMCLRVWGKTLFTKDVRTRLYPLLEKFLECEVYNLVGRCHGNFSRG